MDSVTEYYQIIYPILKEYADLPYRYREIQRRLIVSEDKQHYLFMTWGWENGRRLHGCIVHLEIIDDKIWIVHKNIVKCDTPLLCRRYPNGVNYNTLYPIA
jgi:hypothetical protein